MKKDPRPNILHILVDQMRWDCIQALGNPFIKTPALDRLFAQGAAFTNAFSPSPVCIPARASMIYGQYPQTTGCYENNFPMPPETQDTFMGRLTQEGYRTHGIGKCHFTPNPLALRGFQTRETQEELPDKSEDDDYLSFLHSNGYSYVIDPHGVRGEMYYIPQVSQIPQTLHPTRWVGDRSLAFLKEQKDAASPWYLFSSFIHPHPPLSPPSPWHKLYGYDDVPLPRVPVQYESLLTYVNRAQNRYKYRDQGVDLNVIRMIRAYYYASISFIDHQVGRILDTLEATGALANTLVVFASDHGEYLGDYHCYGKRGMHDAAARVPFLVSQPGVFEGGRVYDQPISLIDLAPTFLKAAGSHENGGASFDGLPLQDAISGTNTRDRVFSQLSFVEQADGTRGGMFFRPDPITDENRAANSSYMVATKDHKYIYCASDNKELFFDRRRDPFESRNRVHARASEKVVHQLRVSLMEHLKKGGETAGIENGTWKVFPARTLPDDPDFGLLTQDQPWADLDFEGQD